MNLERFFAPYADGVDNGVQLTRVTAEEAQALASKLHPFEGRKVVAATQEGPTSCVVAHVDGVLGGVALSVGRPPVASIEIAIASRFLAPNIVDNRVLFSLFLAQVNAAFEDRNITSVVLRPGHSLLSNSLRRCDDVAVDETGQPIIRRETLSNPSASTSVKR